MPRKPTKLKYLGIAVRRRTLYALTVFFAVISVPTVSWAILVQQTNVGSMDKYKFIAAAGVTLFGAFHGWFIITRHNPIFYRNEARVIWLGGMLLLVIVTGLGCAFSDSVIRPLRMAYGAPLLLGGGLMLFFIFQCFRLGQLPKRGDIVRGESGPLRKKSRSSRSGQTPLPVATVDHAESTDAADGDEGIDDEAPTGENSPPSRPPA